MEFPTRAQAHGPALIGLLTRLTGAHALPAPLPLSERLAAWIGWPQAVALAAALDTRMSSPEPGAGMPIDDDEIARVRGHVAAAITGDRAFAGADARPAEAAFYRQRHVALQQVMEGEVGLLRKRLRERLARRAAHMGALAAVDGVMEKALGARERAALAALPDVLAANHERLRVAASDKGADRAVAWLATFRHDMRCLLLAELDFRLQPTRGLVAALRSTLPESA